MFGPLSTIITSSPPAGGGGSLVASSPGLPASLDLTALGYADYIKHRTGLGGQDLQKTGRPFLTYEQDPTPGFGNAAASYTPLSTIPTISATDWVNLHTGAAIGSLSEATMEVIYNDSGTPAIRYVCPVGTTPKVIDIIWGSCRNDTYTVPGTVGWTASLSDASATPYTATAVAPGNMQTNVYMTRLTFNAASEGQELTIDVACTALVAVQAVILH
jgi:hypothetical protein